MMQEERSEESVQLAEDFIWFMLVLNRAFHPAQIGVVSRFQASVLPLNYRACVCVLVPFPLLSTATSFHCSFVPF